ncbi:NAD(P)-dependent oxidoreductase [Paracoccus gahaiensis]|uniref:NAD(P)-dependent oxidoreductase n=1 Tax=Paracoccus gahaiensis TaxID=1706839 RepID=A0A4U0R7P1_9RHOB|nr:NAD(P)-dependent oxidoreductase [Paracoccus gahaiensis]TJZ91039.1 NAD(P)-dependent oxidoreductase [Paracoccus gahaiensis]
MRVALTGASGIIGSAVARALSAAGHEVTPLGRAQGWQLGMPAPLGGQEALIHCALAHAPGRYRGGEGDDPAGFLAANLDGTRALFDQAAQQGLGRVLFLSSRAVHDGYPAGMRLPDDLPPRPTSLYGQVKAGAEAHLARLPLSGCAIRATGIYGPGPAHKWRPLFAEYLAGRPIAPRVATEVHVDDLAQALILLLTHPAPLPAVNCSDLILDRHDLLGMVRDLTACPHPPPPRADPSPLRLPDCTALTTLGWHPGGVALLSRALPALLRD